MKVTKDSQRAELYKDYIEFKHRNLLPMYYINRPLEGVLLKSYLGKRGLTCRLC